MLNHNVVSHNQEIVDVRRIIHMFGALHGSFRSIDEADAMLLAFVENNARFEDDLVRR